MEIISLTKLSDDGWQNYFSMSKEILRRHYPERYNDEGSWHKQKDKWLKHYELSKSSFYDEYLISENGTAVAWVDYAVSGEDAAFGFETIFNVIPEYVLKPVLNEVYKFLIDRKLHEVYHRSFSPRRTEAMKRINSEIYDEMLIQRLEREMMNRKLYEEITGELDNLNDYTLRFYNEIPVWLIDKYVLLSNKMFEEINTLNPTGARLPLIQKVDWIERVEIDKHRGTVMNMYILFDSNNDIAALSSLYIDSYNKQTVRHNGGLTAVSSKHRGKGFAKFLKAKMYLKILEENRDFKFITTDTMQWNKPMYRINEGFGFKPYKQGCNFKLTKAFLEDYLR